MRYREPLDAWLHPARKIVARRVTKMRHRPTLLLTLPLILAAGWQATALDTPASVRVHIIDADTEQPLPSRLTILDERGEMAAVSPNQPVGLAVRPGVVYTGTGEASFTLPKGRYTLYATRGLEYGLGQRSFVAGNGPAELRLKLPREVDTHDYISCDTHIHTLTFSGHGDARIEERMATIAGEGIELAVATDHNHHTDYAPVARATGTDAHFTPVVGNEVTTKVGHFNAFPIRSGSRVVNDKLTDWKALLTEIRATPGVRVVTLNHPGDDHGGFIPDDPRRFHPASGESLDGAPWSFDGIEVVTSAALQSDWTRTYRDWFALLNRGQRIVGLGSSDTHDVNRFILGQARTYVASKAARPDHIDLDEACDSILAGKVLVSMGLLTEAWVDGKYGVGDLAPAASGPLKLRVRVQGPRWVTADRLEVYANGEKVVDQPITPKKGVVVKEDLTLSLPRPRQDTWLVVIATGPGVREPYWPISRPYQPTRADWDPRVIGSTSPIRVDADGDGRYYSPADYARRIVETNASDPQKLLKELTPYDAATSVQAASLCRWQGLDLRANPFRRAIEDAPAHVRHGFVAYRNLLATPK